MIKKWTLFSLFFLFFAAAVPVQAGGTYKCRYVGGLCSPEIIDCGGGAVPASDNYCSAHDGNETACVGVPPRACVDPTNTTFRCLGSGVCEPCASDESCPYTSSTACENEPSCKNSHAPGPLNPENAEFTGYCPNKSGIKTAIGCIPFESPKALTAFFIRWGIGIGGGITMLLLIYGGFLVMTSAGDPKRLQGGRELVTSAISGLVLIIFSIFVLRLLGVDVLGLF